MERQDAALILDVVLGQMRVWDKHPAELLQQYEKELGEEYKRKWQSQCVAAIETAMEVLRSGGKEKRDGSKDGTLEGEHRGMAPADE